MKVLNHVRTCREESCGVKLVMIYNVETKAFVPVDFDSLNIYERNSLDDVLDSVLPDCKVLFCFDKERHVSHFKTCKNPDRFTHRKRKDWQPNGITTKRY